MRPPLISGHSTFSKIKEADLIAELWAYLRPISCELLIRRAARNKNDPRKAVVVVGVELAHRSSNNDSDVATVAWTRQR